MVLGTGGRIIWGECGFVKVWICLESWRPRELISVMLLRTLCLFLCVSVVYAANKYELSQSDADDIRQQLRLVRLVSHAPQIDAEQSEKDPYAVEVVYRCAKGKAHHALWDAYGAVIGEESNEVLSVLRGFIKRKKDEGLFRSTILQDILMKVFGFYLKRKQQVSFRKGERPLDVRHLDLLYSAEKTRAWSVIPLQKDISNDVVWLIVRGEVLQGEATHIVNSSSGGEQKTVVRSQSSSADISQLLADERVRASIRAFAGGWARKIKENPKIVVHYVRDQKQYGGVWNLQKGVIGHNNKKPHEFLLDVILQGTFWVQGESAQSCYLQNKAFKHERLWEDFLQTSLRFAVVNNHGWAQLDGCLPLRAKHFAAEEEYSWFIEQSGVQDRMVDGMWRLEFANMVLSGFPAPVQKRGKAPKSCLALISASKEEYQSRLLW